MKYIDFIKMKTERGKKNMYCFKKTEIWRNR